MIMIKPRAKQFIAMALILLGIIMMCIGFKNGENETIHHFGANVCGQCIGLS